MARKDPYHGFRFLVECEGLVTGGFTRVKGLARETKFESFREGGVNDFDHKLASATTYPPLVLEHGLADKTLWNWHRAVSEGDITRRKISIILKDERGNEAWRWHADGAFPVKWSVSDLDAANSQVTVETVEIVHHGLREG